MGGNKFYLLMFNSYLLEVWNKQGPARLLQIFQISGQLSPIPPTGEQVLHPTREKWFYCFYHKYTIVV